MYGGYNIHHMILCRMVEWLPTHRVKELLKVALSGDGALRFSRHCEKALADDNLTIVDARNCLHGGVVDDGELEMGSWRYRVRTKRMCVVIAFESIGDGEVVVSVVAVTAWLFKGGKS
jgi:hypothetical protein